MRGVTWLELLVDFEVASGLCYKHPQSTADWGKRAEMLRGIVKLILQVRGPGRVALETIYGTPRRIISVAPCGALHIGGLLRRPTFVSGHTTIRAIAVNAWQWAEGGQQVRLQLHQLTYRGFNTGVAKSKEVEEEVDKKLAEPLVEEVRPTTRSISTSSTYG